MLSNSKEPALFPAQMGLYSIAVFGLFMGLALIYYSQAFLPSPQPVPDTGHHDTGAATIIFYDTDIPETDQF